MISEHELMPLRRALIGNRCVLMLGAGFSADAFDSTGRRLPAGQTLAGELWALLGYDETHGPFEGGTSLEVLFDAARARLGDRAVLKHMQERLTVRTYPDWYHLLTMPFWYRIYTTNVDDLIERVWRDAGRRDLQVINAIQHAYRDRDPFLEKLQYVKLNGDLAPEDLDQIEFGSRQRARRSSEAADPWFSHFVSDYSQYTTILVGTQLDEPMFWRAIQSREQRGQAVVDRRARSFLVAPKLNPALTDSLAQFNVVPVPATGAEFFEWLFDEIGELPGRTETVMATNPGLLGYLEIKKDDIGAPERGALKQFFGAFQLVEPVDPPREYRSLYLLGASPTWLDIAANQDARREITSEYFEAAQAALETEGQAPSPVVISGHRGAGKSTVLMRTAWDLAAAGYQVFLGSGEDVPPAHVVAKAVAEIPGRIGLAVDDADWIAGRVGDYLSAFEKLERPPLLLLAIRSNQLYKLEERDVLHDDYAIKDLSPGDIAEVVKVLRREGRLGALVAAGEKEIVEAFERRAKKQLLVALKEVTSGEEFDVIIGREFDDLDRVEYRITYLVACLATSAGASLRRDQLIAATDLTPAEILSALDREYRQLLVQVGSGNLLAARHQLIAQTIVDGLAPRDQLGLAYRRLLVVLADDMGPERSAQRWFRLYKRVINHDEIFRRFQRDLEEARAIFDSIRRRFERDPHFWLQYGSLELQYGELDLADHYLHTAETLRPEDFMIRHATAHLRMKQAKEAASPGQAAAFRREGEDVLWSLIEERETPYPWHTLIAYRHFWLQKWEPDSVRRRAEYEELRDLAVEACEAFPWNRDLRAIKEDVDRAYLSTAL